MRFSNLKVFPEGIFHLNTAPVVENHDLTSLRCQRTPWESIWKLMEETLERGSWIGDGNKKCLKTAQILIKH